MEDMKKKITSITLVLAILLILAAGVYLITKKPIRPIGKAIGIVPADITPEGFRCDLYELTPPLSAISLDPIIDIEKILRVSSIIITGTPSKEVYLGEPYIYKNNIVWVDHKKKKIIGYNTTTKAIKEITQGESFNTSPRLHRDYIAWIKERTKEDGIPTGIKDIYIYDTKRDRAECITESITDYIEREDLTIDNNKAAWLEGNGIRVYDIRSGTSFELNNPDTGYSDPYLYRDKIVYIKWEKHGNQQGKRDICIYSLDDDKETVIVPEIKSAYSPRLNKDWLVWLERAGPNIRINTYNIKTGMKKQILLPDRIRLFEFILSREDNLLLIKGGRLREEKDRKMCTYIYNLDRGKWVYLDTRRKPIEYGLSISGKTICWSTGKEICLWRIRP